MKTSIRKGYQWLLLAVFALLLSMGAGKITYAANVWNVKVDTSYLALRNAKAFDASNEIGKLYTGDSVDVTDTSDATYWYVYSPKYGKYGYVNKNYLVKTSQSSDSTPAPAATHTVANLQSGYLALRTSKVYDNNNIIGKLYNGDTVTVSDTSDATYWYVYSSKLGKSGYVNKAYLVASSQPAPTSGSYVVSNLLSGYLALRNAKAFDYNNEIGKLYNGDVVTVSDTSDATYWYVYSSKLGKSGYVNKAYLTASSQPAPTSDSYVVSNLLSGYLALRNAKAFDYNNEIGKLYNGDVVTVSDKSDASYWYVTSSKLGKSGYVNKDYLTPAQSQGVRYVVISDYVPGIALHPTPDMNSAVLATLSKGTSVVVTAYSGDYGYTNYNGINGWVNLKLCAKN